MNMKWRETSSTVLFSEFISLEKAAEATRGHSQQLQLFAFLNLGVIQSLKSGVISATEAVKQFYHAENCLYIKDFLSNAVANKIMSHGVQLPDIFNCLSSDEAQQEFYMSMK